MDELACTRTDHDPANDDARGAPAKQFDETTANIQHFGARIRVQGEQHGVDAHVTRVHLLLGHADRRNLRGREDRAGHDTAIKRTDGVTQGVPHGDTPLHRSDRCQHEHSGAIPRRVHPARRGPGHAIHHDEAAFIALNPGLIEPQPCCIGHRADGEEHVASLDHRAIGQRDEDSLIGAVDGGSARM